MRVSFPTILGLLAIQNRSEVLKQLRIPATTCAAVIPMEFGHFSFMVLSGSLSSKLTFHIVAGDNTERIVNFDALVASNRNVSAGQRICASC